MSLLCINNKNEITRTFLVTYMYLHNVYRAAATRCREKRKIWIQALEKKAEEMSELNSQLQVSYTISTRLIIL